MKIFEIGLDENKNFESYIDRWNREVSVPLLEWHKMVSEAKLSTDQINALFGNVENKMAGEKTMVGKGAAVVSQVLPSNITAKIHELIKDTKPINNFDAAFEQARTHLANKLGGDSSKIVKYTTWMSQQAKAHPIIAGAVIGILTAATALAAGGVSAGIVGALLRTGVELLKGETLSKSLSKGVGTGLVGMLAGMSISTIGDWLSHFTIDSTTVPGYVDLVKVTMLQETNGTFNLNIDAYMTPELYNRLSKIKDMADDALANGDYRKAVGLYNKITEICNDPDYVNAINNVIGDNEKLAQAAKDGASTTANVFSSIAAGVQGAITAAARSKNKKDTTVSENRNLTEADLKGIASSIANWAKTNAGAALKQASQKITTEKLITAWKAAGEPTDSGAIYSIMLQAGVPNTVLATAYKENSIPAPRKANKPRERQSVNTGDAELDKTVNDIMARKGKDAAIAYLTDLKTKTQSAPAASSKHGTVRKASDNQTYKLDVGKSGDRIWFNVQTGAEAPTAIDTELEQGTVNTPVNEFTAISRDVHTRLRTKPISEALSLLNEAKARIDHPEDLVIDEGAAGAKRALNAMISLVNRPRSVTIKMDGSPALIFGWDEQGFVLTDKSGFGAKGYDGMTRSAEAVTAMLRGDTGRRIKDTSPDGMAVRDQYAKSIAGLYNMLKALVPQSLTGYLQGDLLWQGTPALVDSNYEFGPLKIKYKIPANTQLGKQIGSSRAGIVIHSMFETRDDQEPSAIDNINELNLNTVPGLVVIPHELNIVNKLELPTQLVSKLNSAITVAAPLIDKLFDGTIKSLPALMKSYLAWKAGKGNSDFAVSPTEFVTWLDGPASKATDSMRKKVKEHIDQNIDGYHAIWQLIQSLNAVKLYIKQQLDKSAESTLAAEFSTKAHPELQGKGGHEGFVADTEHGKIKLVNRSEFMRKHDTVDEPLNEYASSGASAAGSVASVANPFGFTISRTPNLFGYIPEQPKKKKAKRKAPKYP